MSALAPAHAAAGPFFEDLEVGLRVDDAPALTLTDGLAAAHRAILGGRMRLALDAELCHAVTGERRLLADPQLVCDVAIGQSTLLTQRVIANLFYRGLAFHRLPRIGDTLRCSTEVVALRQTSAKPGRPARGLAALRIRTVDQGDRPVLDFHRCAMLPLRDPDGATGRADDLAAVGTAEPPAGLAAELLADWDLALHRAASGGDGALLQAGAAWDVAAGDVVSSAGAGAPVAERRRCPPRCGPGDGSPARLRRAHDRAGGCAGDAGAAGARGDRRMAWLRSPRARLRGRHAHEPDRAGARRAARTR
jgi:acyl dehydratase